MKGRKMDIRWAATTRGYLKGGMTHRERIRKTNVGEETSLLRSPPGKKGGGRGRQGERTGTVEWGRELFREKCPHSLVTGEIPDGN